MRKILFALMFALLLIPAVSGFEFDDIRTYDAGTQTVRLENAFTLGHDIVKVQLITRGVNWVTPGPEVRFAEMVFTPDEDGLETPILAMRLHDEITDVDIERDIIYKKRVFVRQISVDDYGLVCIKNGRFYKNGTTKSSCEVEIVGSHLESIYRWEKINPRDKITEEIVIGLFTRVYAGDRVEWIPTINKVGEVPEWALFVGLTIFEINIPTINSGIALSQNEVGTQSFNASDSYTFQGAGFVMSLNGNDPDINFSIWEDVDGDDTVDFGSDILLGVNNSVDTVLLSTIEDRRINITISSDPSGFVDIIQGKKYILRIENIDAVNNNINVRGSNVGDPYTNGTCQENGVQCSQIPDMNFLVYGNQSIAILDMTLNSPIDNLITTETTLDFNVTLTPTIVNLTNATLFVFNLSGGVVNDTSTNIVTGTEPNQTIFTLVNLEIETLSWNVLGCGADEFGVVLCEFANNNFTFTRQAFATAQQSFSNNTFETQSERYFINLTTIPEILSVEANLVYNGTSFPATTSCNASGFCQIDRTIDVTLVDNGLDSQLKNFLWEVIVFDGTSNIVGNSSIAEQNVSRIRLENCAAPVDRLALNFSALDEQNLTRVSPFTFQGTFEVFFGNGTTRRNSTFDELSVVEKNICIFPDNRTFITDAIIEYGQVAGANVTYNDRNHFLENASVSNVTQDIDLFLLRSTESTSFILRVLDNTLDPIQGALIFIQKFFPGEDLFRTVQIAKTDDNGETIGFFEVETVDYKFIISEGGTVILDTNPQKVVGKEVPFTLEFFIGLDLGKPWEAFEGLGNFQSVLTFNETNEIVTYTYLDTSGEINFARLVVSNINQSTSDTTICDVTSTQSSATILCNVTGFDGQFKATSTVSRSPDVIDKVLIFVIRTAKDIFGRSGILLGWFLLLVAGFVGIWNPVVGVMLIIGTAILVNAIGLLSFGPVAIFGIIAIGALIIVEMNT
ncbi:hypothetical protein LCGC14_1355520 [marine sediment metagenome]|uniref:Uncharacterized protein n=1 Tax=marine sediment metagenome TaxID=412755 RepID=A0A0F9NBY5_9ZZZZ